MAFTMSRFAHLVGRPMRPSPEYVGIRSAIRFHSSSVKSPCTDRHVVEMDSSGDPMGEAYGIWPPAWRQYYLLTGNTLSTATEPMVWLAKKGKPWCDQVRFATLDLSGPYRKVFTLMTPGAVQVADPFHLVKLANTKLDECRRRVQNETLGHRGRKSDPLYRCRRLLTKAKERLDDKGNEKLVGLLAAGDPHGDVATMWQAKGAGRELYAHGDPELALQWVTELGRDLQDKDYPIESRSLGRCLLYTSPSPRDRQK